MRRTTRLMLALLAIFSAVNYASAEPIFLPRFTLTKQVNPALSGEISAVPAPDNDGLYTSGTLVTLTAHPAPGYVFAFWTGGITAANNLGNVNPRQVVMNENRTLTANFTSQTLEARFTLSKFVNPVGSGEIGVQPPPGNDGKYSSGTLVTLTAHPAIGKTFLNWSGSVTGTTNPRELRMSGNKSVTANFSGSETPRFSLGTSVNPQDGGNVVLNPPPGNDGKYSSGTLVSMTAHPAPGYVFFGWSGGGGGAQPAVIITENPRNVLMNENKSFIAYFEPAQEQPRFALTRIANPPGSGEIGVQPLPGPDGKYTSGTIVGLTPHPAPGYVFHSWNGPVIYPNTSIGSGPYVRMDANKTVTANFVQQQEQPRVTLYKIINPPGSGEVSLQPPPGQDGKYTSGTVVTLTAHPAPGNTFLNWGGAITGTQNPRTILMNGNKEIVANFGGSTIGARFTLTKQVMPQGAGHIEVSPQPGQDGKYSSGTLVLLGAYPAPGFRFVHWSGASASTSNPIQLKMTENKSVTAHFETVSAQSADLMVYLNLSHNPVINHTPFLMSVHVANRGPSSATNTRFEVHLPPGVQFTSSTISQGTVHQTNSGVLVGQLGSMPAGGNAVAGLILVPHTTGTLESVAHVDADQPDPYLPNNESHRAVKVVSQFLPSPDLGGYTSLITRKVTATASKVSGNFVFANSGETPSGKCVVQYFLSDDDVLDPSDQLVRTQRLGTLRAGAAVSKKFSLKLSANAEGQRIIGVLDPADINAEGNEVNNTIVSPPVP